MKKHTAFLALAAIMVLPACSGHNYRYNESENGGYTVNREDMTNADNTGANDNGYEGKHSQWKEAKLDAMVNSFFDKADTNHDGYISWKEFEAFMHKKFREADKDHDRMLSHDEVKDMMKAHMERIREKMREDKESMNRGSDDNANGGEIAGDTENTPRYNSQE